MGGRDEDLSDAEVPRWLQILGVVVCAALSAVALVTAVADDRWDMYVGMFMPLPLAALLGWKLRRGDRRLF